eukprot:scaffold102147_cov29-Tisochrysis_lutea.AAC.5
MALGNESGERSKIRGAVECDSQAQVATYFILVVSCHGACRRASPLLRAPRRGHPAGAPSRPDGLQLRQPHAPR